MAEQPGRYAVGTVPYLNGAPLTYGLEREAGVDLVEEPPARLIEGLREGRLHVALASSIGALESDAFGIVGRIAIACRGEVESIRLFSRGQPYAVSRIALDASSRTSAALLKIILQERYYARPDYVEMAPDLTAMLAVADAALLIGDAALTAQPEGLQVLDLGAEWWELTQLPMVFAVWMARRDAALGSLPSLLEQARANGVAHLDEVSAVAAKRLGLTGDACREYLQRFVPYTLGEDEVAGLRAFGELAHKHGLIKSLPSPEFLP
jgi:chorismate dehydratase